MSTDAPRILFGPEARLTSSVPLITTRPLACSVIDPLPHFSTTSWEASNSRRLPSSVAPLGRSGMSSSVGGGASASVTKPTITGRSASPSSRNSSTGTDGFGVASRPAGRATVQRAATGSRPPTRTRPRPCSSSPTSEPICKAGSASGAGAGDTSLGKTRLISVLQNLAALDHHVAAAFDVDLVALDGDVAVLLHDDLGGPALEVDLVFADQLDLLGVEDVFLGHRRHVLAADGFFQVLADLRGRILGHGFAGIAAHGDRLAAADD